MTTEASLHCYGEYNEEILSLCEVTLEPPVFFL